MLPNLASAVLLTHIGFIGLAPDDMEASVPSEMLSRKLRKQTFLSNTRKCIGSKNGILIEIKNLF